MTLLRAPALVLFLGGMGGSDVEEMVASAQQAILWDVLERAQATGAFDKVILATDRQNVSLPPEARVEVDFDQGPFHFGQRLCRIIQRHGLFRPFYVGGGSIPLLSSSELGAIAQQLATASDTVISNNFFSADLFAFTPGAAIEKLELPARDNPIPRLLVEQAGLNSVTLPRTAATQFDVDTPTDLLVLQLHPATPPATHAYIESLHLDCSRLRRAISYFRQSSAQILVAGRGGSHLWSKLEQATACRVRFLAEERGMVADGREGHNEARSILGFYLEEVGPTRFFRALAELGNAAFIDSRVIFQHLKLNVSRRDRFLSDLGQADGIDNSRVREFTQAALEAPIPVVLGGHSLVSGGLLALLEVA